MAAYEHIQVLPAQIANKIAAGEVVERPASLLKELVENSVDAGATQIDVDVVAGGHKLVSIRDNGRGMNRDDALLSLERHATSKIRDVDDIETIDTMGFRGEALAAISSVSRYHMMTCRAGENVGTEITVTGGKISDVRDTGGPAGTLIEVRDLFFNVPARRKFMRSQQTELAHLRSGFIVQALAHPAVGMSLRVDGRETYRLAPGAALDDRLRELFGTDYVRNLRAIGYVSNGVAVSGYVSTPMVSRSDRNEQYIFVNGRPTSAPVVGFAIREGYHTLLPADRQPLVFMFVELDAGQVDVNVHPTKREVRFREGDAVRDAVVQAVRKALMQDPTRLTMAVPVAPQMGPSSAVVATPAATELQLTIENLPPTRAFQYPRLPMGTSAGTSRQAGPLTAAPVPDAAPPVTPIAGSTPAPDGGTSPWAWCRVIGQIGNLYVVLETEDGYALMDPHAAHERILFERFIHDVMRGSVHSQSLLIPETVEMEPRDAVRVRKNLDTLKGMGFGVSEFGGDSFVVDALPAYFQGASVRTLLTDVAAELERAGARGGRERWCEEAIAQAACKAAVKARDRLTLDAIEQLVVDLARTEMPYTCPHGRPTMIFTSFKELNRKFGRE
jgi:DNA mismatch repair protein MutL